jgi:excisionase family DNA binding protein
MEPIKQEHTESAKGILLRIPKAAGMLDLSVAKVYAMAASGQLPSIRVGRAVRIPAASLSDWVETHTRGRTDA